MSYDEIRKAFENLPPPPKFDRVCVRDETTLGFIPRRDPSQELPSGSILPLHLTGLPVVLDGDMEQGVIELRKGDEVVARHLIPELRA